MIKSANLDSYGKFKIEQQREYKNNVWTSYEIIKKIKEYIARNNLEFSNALDPCAGSGRLIKEFKEYNWQGYEIDENVYKECITDDIKDKIENLSFFDSECEVDKYDLCICNPPYNKVGGLNKWLEHIFWNLSGYLFLIVPYNFINKIKDEYKNLIVDYISDYDMMDRSFHNKVMIYVFDTNAQQHKVIDDLFYLDVPEHLKKDKVIYLRDYLEEVNVQIPKYKKIKDIPEGTEHPVFTIASRPVKYTDLSTSCPGNVILYSNSYINSSICLKYTEEAPYLNTQFKVFKFKNQEAKEYIVDNLFVITQYLRELFKFNMVTTLIDALDILNIPIYKNTEEQNAEKNETIATLDLEFEKFVKRFKYYDKLKNYKIEWI